MPITDITIEPRQPRRLEKKANIYGISRGDTQRVWINTVYFRIVHELGLQRVEGSLLRVEKWNVVVIIFGVSGAGKTTVGKLLAEGLRWRFIEADDFHSSANIDKMRQGIPLTDEDRQPWLAALRKLINQYLNAEENAVLACSALKENYRRYLAVSPDVRFVYLRGDYTLVDEQLRHRRGHFFDPKLLHAQFTDLEEPQPAEGALVIELGRSPRELAEEIRSKLRRDAS